MKTIINILPDGTIESLSNVDIPDAVVVSKVRASTIEPYNPIKRLAFRALRIAFGDDGRIADWTRTWVGDWTVTILGSGRTHTRWFRADCIQWEREHIAGLQLDRT